MKLKCQKHLCGLCRSRHKDGVKFRAQFGGDFECPEGKPWTDGQWIPPRLAGTMRALNAMGAPGDVVHVATPAPPVDVAAVARSTARFEICKTCEHSKDAGFKCELHKSCCFGRWRANPDNKCPKGKW